jgi:hypothetical protein
MASIQKRDNGSGEPASRRGGQGTRTALRRKVDASKWLDEVTAAVLTGQYVGPKAGRITFRVFFESWAQRQVWASGTRKAMERKPLAPGTIHTRVPNLRWRVTPRATLCGLRGASSVLTCDDAEHQTLKRDDHTGFRLVGSP